MLPVGGGLAATRQRIADTRARLQAFFREGGEQGKGGAVVSAPVVQGRREAEMEVERERDIRRTWAAVLKVSPHTRHYL